ncbi:hypothetical protein Q760_15875 [Cellulomonas cellasea DSM 20118]|uniref:Histidine kinase/HSP90-like ATPase domain-containing protein n=2 Tax=Cellulomonas cellasea TaxID=43670 RepID=A0A0A0B7C4_9CELL|nr:hypothetical protein Q760_15875 [Cellulomonas cellasea DSM 20118]
MIAMKLHLAPLPGAARRARSCVRLLLDELDIPGSTVEVLDLLLTEVVTNAVRHGTVRDTLTLTVSASPDEVTVGVGDDNPDPPRVLDPPPEALGGRGMQLVDRLADEWGVDDRPGGKSVWFRLALREDAGSEALAG